MNYGVGRNGAGVIFNNVGAEYFKEFFDMRGELTDISEAEALELIKNYVNDRKLASVPDASFLFYLVFLIY